MSETTAIPVNAGRQLAPGDFASAWTRHHRVLWCVAVGVLGSSSEADDVLQEAAVIALQKLDQFKPGTSELAWLSQIVRHVSNNARRKTTRRRTLLRHPKMSERLHTDQAVSEPKTGAEAVVSRDGQLTDAPSGFDERLLAALGALADTARACLLLRTVVGLGYEQISEALDIPAGTAMSHVHRARGALRRSLTSGGETS